MHARSPLPVALSHPLWWGALALLLLNDHVLKGSGLLPGLVTERMDRSYRSSRIVLETVNRIFSNLEENPAFAPAGLEPYREAARRWQHGFDRHVAAKELPGAVAAEVSEDGDVSEIRLDDPEPERGGGAARRVGRGPIAMERSQLQEQLRRTPLFGGLDAASLRGLIVLNVFDASRQLAPRPGRRAEIKDPLAGPQHSMPLLDL